jgi:hypothetical protein
MPTSFAPSRSRARNGVRFLVVALLATVGAAVSADAAVWTAPLTVSQFDSAVDPGRDVAMDASGAAAFAWTEGGTVRATLRRAGGGFNPTGTLGAQASSAPSVALSGGGTAFVVWNRQGGLAASFGAASGSLGALPDLGSGVTGRPDVAFLSGGRAVVVWGGADGAIHAVERAPNGALTTLPDLSTGAGNSAPVIAAAGDQAVVAWVASETVGDTRTTRLRVALRAPGQGFAAPEDVATRSVVRAGQASEAGTDVTSPAAAISANGAADVSVVLVNLIGLAGDFGANPTLFSRPPGGTWATPQTFEGFDARLSSAPLTNDLAAGRVEDAMYVAGNARGEMQFYGHLRAAESTAFGPRQAILTGPAGEIRAAPLGARQFLAVLRSGGAVQSHRQAGAAGFGSALPIVSAGALRLLGAAGAPNGEAVAAWQLTDGRFQVALYDDNAVAAGGVRPPAPARDTTRPVLSRLQVAPARFAVRRGRGRSARGGGRIRWILSEAATVRLRVEREKPGFRRGGQCVARRPSSGRVRRCTRFVSVRSIARAARAGRASIAFAGRVGARPLAAGRYRLSAQATDRSRNRSRTRRTSFTIVRR